MKALTLWQPWASLVAMGVKKIETRSWTTKYRGPIAIHSARRFPPDWLGASRHSQAFQSELRSVFSTTLQCQMERKVYELPRGCILCTVILLGIERTEDVRDGLDDRERVFGNYEDGRYAWHFELSLVLPHAIPVKGNRMLWNWTNSGSGPVLGGRGEPG
jgi:activating signal cointegrator 1